MSMLAGMFTGEAERHYWSRARTSWTVGSSASRIGRRFLAFVGGEHARAIAAGPPTRSAAAPSPPDVRAAGAAPAWRTASTPRSAWVPAWRSDRLRSRRERPWQRYQLQRLRGGLRLVMRRLLDHDAAEEH
ncbi:DUF6082 family protein [Streptomyces shenzhenensis]|uniref:DUF6082 family protein n=1 Tax=Streptomyces shenzhenensis TaxID=943815 RepID=UPI00355601CD